MLLTLLASAALAASQQPQTGGGNTSAIHGQVRQAGSQIPIADVEVAVECGAKSDHETTDEQGRYRSEELPRGLCTVRISHHGLERERRVVSGAAGTEPQIDFWLPVPGQISGRVLGEHDEPRAGVRVMLFERAVVLGSAKYSVRGGGQTDASGEYTIPGVAPNRSLTLLALPAASNDPPAPNLPDDPAKRQAIDSLAFYPGSPQADGAMPIRLQPGEQRVAVDIHLERTKTLCVSGTVESAGKPVPADLRLVNRQLEAAGGVGFALGATAKAGPDGQFTICGVSAGAYKLIGYQRGVEGETAFYGSLDIELSDRDLQNLRVLPDFMMPLAGTAVWDADATNQEPMKLNVSLSPWNGVVIANVGHELRQAISVPGKFRWPELRRDAFRPTLGGLTGFVYVKSMTYGGHDLRHELLRVGEAFEGSELKIVLGVDGGKISIAAVDDKGGPLPDMTILVSPDGAAPATITDELVEGVTDKDGFFVTGALAPGRYRVLVRTESADRSPESLPSLAQALASGEAVELAPKSLRDVRIAVR